MTNIVADNAVTMKLSIWVINIAAQHCPCKAADKDGRDRCGSRVVVSLRKGFNNCLC
ncbi:MAG: hypothetical protein ACOC8C_00240 [Chloroflexota bacterium]